jgi:hypothetical protein
MAGETQILDLIQVLFKQQTTFGTPEVALIASDLLEVESGAQLQFDPSITEMALVGAGFPQNEPVIGPSEASVSLSVPLRTGGVEGNTGYVGKLLPCLGMKETASDSDADLANDRYIYTFSNKQSEWKDATVWGYTGNLDANSSVVRKCGNLMFGGDLNIDFDKSTAMLSLSGKGAYVAAAVVGTQATTSPSGILIPEVKNATVSIMANSTIVPVDFKISFSQEAQPRLNPRVSYGKGLTVVRGRKLKWTSKVYIEKPATFDPEALLYARTKAALSISWGTVPNKITISSAKQLITGCNYSEHGGIQCWDLSGIFVDNDLSIQLDTAVAA